MLNSCIDAGLISLITIKPCLIGNVERRSFSDLFEDYFHRRVNALDVLCQPRHDPHMPPQPWPLLRTIALSSFKVLAVSSLAPLATAMDACMSGTGWRAVCAATQSALTGIPQPVSSSFERKGEQCDGHGGKGGNGHPRLVKKLAELNGREWDHLIAGTVFFFGPYFAYFVVTWDEGKIRQ